MYTLVGPLSFDLWFKLLILNKSKQIIFNLVQRKSPNVQNIYDQLCLEVFSNMLNLKKEKSVIFLRFVWKQIVDSFVEFLGYAQCTDLDMSNCVFCQLRDLSFVLDFQMQWGATCTQVYTIKFRTLNPWMGFKMCYVWLIETFSNPVP